MAGFQTGGDDDVISGINVTPLVDVVLVLLIIFMVTASYIVRAQIQVDLPKAATGESEVEAETVTIQVTEKGVYSLDGEVMSLDAIGASIARTVDDEPKVRAVIAADRDVAYGKVVDAIDTLKSNGLNDFALNIEREGE